MIAAKLTRFYAGPFVTLGLLKINNEHKPIFTLERAWQDNKNDVSCIPTGCYKVVPFSSLEHPNVFKLLEVPDRDGVLIHVGNYTSNTKGCILVGLGVNGVTPMVSNSDEAMMFLRSLIGNDTFTLTIEDYHE